MYGSARLLRSLRMTDKDAAARLIDDRDALLRGDVEIRPAISDTCFTIWTQHDAAGFMDYLDPQLCLITGKRGDQRRIEPWTQITAESFGQFEREFLKSGELLFGNPGGNLSI